MRGNCPGNPQTGSKSGEFRVNAEATKVTKQLSHTGALQTVELARRPLPPPGSSQGRQNRPLRGGPPDFDDELGLLRVGRPRRGGVGCALPSSHRFSP
jgi:hypothetical protein